MLHLVRRGNDSGNAQPFPALTFICMSCGMTRVFDTTIHCMSWFDITLGKDTSGAGFL